MLGKKLIILQVTYYLLIFFSLMWKVTDTVMCSFEVVRFYRLSSLSCATNQLLFLLPSTSFSAFYKQILDFSLNMKYL